MWVTVPMPDRSKSPVMSATARGPPGCSVVFFSCSATTAGAPPPCIGTSPAECSSFRNRDRLCAVKPVAARAGILQNAEHFRREGLNVHALHDRAAGALHAGADVVHVPKNFRFRTRGERLNWTKKNPAQTCQHQARKGPLRPGGGFH